MLADLVVTQFAGACLNRETARGYATSVNVSKCKLLLQLGIITTNNGLVECTCHYSCTSQCMSIYSRQHFTFRRPITVSSLSLHEALQKF